MLKGKLRKAHLWLILWATLFSGITSATSNALTPANNPRDYSYYVCYQDRGYIPEVRRGLFKYRKIAYRGCIISKRYCERREDSHQRYFGWFSTYPQARNAFYRCAYRY